MDTTIDQTLESALSERLSLLAAARSLFLELYPHRPLRLRRGDVQKELLLRLEERRTSENRRIISEALEQLGYDRVKIQGFFFYRRKATTTPPRGADRGPEDLPGKA